VAGFSFARGRAFGVAVSLSVALTGCTAQSPLAPDPVGAAALAGPLEAAGPAPPASAAVKTKATATAKFTFRFDMLEGALTLVFADGSALTGNYRGVALNPTVGQPRATFDGVVTGGTGAFNGATGNFTGDGTGGFAGDGEFTASLRGDVRKADGTRVDLRVSLKGAVASICTTEAPPRLFLDGRGSAKAGLGAVVGHLEHDLGTEPCAIIIID